MERGRCEGQNFLPLEEVQRLKKKNLKDIKYSEVENLVQPV
jgi:hypothetical protein